MSMLPWFYHIYKIIQAGWATELSCPSGFLSWPSTQNTLFSQSPCVLIFHGAALRENFSGHRPNVFYYRLLIQAPTVRKFKHLMFSTAEYTGTGDKSSGLCMFLFWVYYSWHIHIDSCRELQEGTTMLEVEKVSHTSRRSQFFSILRCSLPL